MFTTYANNTHSRIRGIIMTANHQAAKMKGFNAAVRSLDANIALLLGQNPDFIELFWLDGCGEAYMVNQGFSKDVIKANKAAVLNYPDRDTHIQLLKTRHGV